MVKNMKQINILTVFVALLAFSVTSADPVAYLGNKSVECGGVHGHSFNTKGECLADFGTPCTTDSDCNSEEFLVCSGDVARTCTCKQPDANNKAWYNAKSGKCEMLLGSMCRLGGQSCSTLPGVDCLEITGTGINVCQCKAGEGLVASSDSTQCYALHDAPCDVSAEDKPLCHPDNYYKCEGGKCACEPNASLDEKTKKCSLLADQVCEVGAGKQPCGARSSCKEGADPAKGTCTCDANYFKNSASLCKLGHGASCQDGANDECNAQGFQKCIVTDGNGKCECESDDLIHINGVCRVKALKPCEGVAGKADCVPHASCQEENPFLNAGITAKICKCESSDHTVNSKGECVLKREAACGGENGAACNEDEFLECSGATTKKCDCKGLGTTTWFNPNAAPSGRCELLLGQACQDNSQSCTSLGGVGCLGADGSKTCKCISNDLEGSNENKQCLVSFGKPCNDGGNAEEKCNAENLYKCENSVCACPDSSGLDGISKKCAKPEGAPCDSASSPTDAPICAEKSKCEKTSILADDGTCKCENGYAANRDKFCKLAWDAKCEKTKDFCNALGFQKCGAGEKCECNNKDAMIHINGVCYIKAGQTCNAVSGAECVAHSICDSPTNTCKCASGHSINALGECVAERGTKCSETGDTDAKCNAEKFLTCTASGGTKTCECAGLGTTSWFNPASDKCELLLNAPCQDGSQSCSTLGGVSCLGTTGSKTCQCTSKELELPSGLQNQCFAPHGFACDDFDPNAAKCNVDNFYVCASNMICACAYGTGLDGKSKKCAKLAGSTCDAPNPPGVPECAEKSGCYAGKCICYVGFIANTQRFCRLPYDAECDGSDDFCNAFAFEKCSVASGTGICECEGKENAIREDGVCKTKVGKPCGTETGPCVAHSKCIENICHCDQGLVLNSKGQCVAEMDVSCGGSGSAPCNDESFLYCNPTTRKCDCAQPSDPNSKVWKNPLNKKCELLLGSNCGGVQTCSSLAGVVCSSNNKCECAAGAGGTDQGLVPSPDGTVCYASFEKYCDAADASKALCNPNAFLSCINRKCLCNEVISWYNTESNICELLINEACNKFAGSQPCTHNSTCDATNKCACGQDLVASDDRRSCIESIGAPCTSDSNCNKEKHFVCIEGKCNCDTNSWFNPKSTRCELLAGSPCLSDPDSQPCTDFSACEGNRGDMKCNCLDGYLESFDGKCVATYGAPCGRDGDAECNPDEFLTCVGGKCSCDSDSWFNPHTAQCQLLAGKTCNVGINDQRCTDFSQCADSGNGKLICKCDSDYISTYEGKCAKDYNATCLRDSECADFFVCEEKKCACDFNAWYNVKTLRCELFAGEFCAPGVGQQSCTEFSACDRGSSGGGYTCNCADGFHATDKRCVHYTCDYDNIQNWLGRRVPRWNY